MLPTNAAIWGCMVYFQSTLTTGLIQSPIGVFTMEINQPDVDTGDLATFIRTRLARGADVSALRASLESKGVSPDSIEEAFQGVLGKLRRWAVLRIVFGLLLVVLGIVLTVVAYEYTDGILLFVWWGAPVAGIMLAISGIVRLCKFNR